MCQIFEQLLNSATKDTGGGKSCIFREVCPDMHCLNPTEGAIEKGTYCGSYSVLENSLYAYVTSNFDLNIYDDAFMEKFFGGTCRSYPM